MEAFCLISTPDCQCWAGNYYEIEDYGSGKSGNEPRRSYYKINGRWEPAENFHRVTEGEQ